ncbi:MAG: hypothetical protein FWE70_02330, partial [Oscillospiraceae bacterium]|nr:hypothetical protein [Oscillospiraceae bacterium]
MADRDDLDVLRGFLNCPLTGTAEVFERFRTVKGALFREAEAGGKQRYLYVEGSRENKVVLVAHADTYADDWYKGCHREVNDGRVIVEDGESFKAVDGSGAPQLLGADDRAGVAMLWLLRDCGHSLLITDGEECGQIGSEWLTEDKDMIDSLNGRHQFMVQLDRRNAKDAKCYCVGTDEFMGYIYNMTGYTEPDKGSSTDICTL